MLAVDSKADLEAVTSRTENSTLVMEMSHANVKDSNPAYKKQIFSIRCTCKR